MLFAATDPECSFEGSTALFAEGDSCFILVIPLVVRIAIEPHEGLLASARP